MSVSRHADLYYPFQFVLNLKAVTHQWYDGHPLQYRTFDTVPSIVVLDQTTNFSPSDHCHTFCSLINCNNLKIHSVILDSTVRSTVPCDTNLMYSLRPPPPPPSPPSPALPPPQTDWITKRRTQYDSTSQLIKKTTASWAIRAIWDMNHAEIRRRSNLRNRYASV